MALSDLFIRLKADASGFKAGMNTAKREAGAASKTVREAENRFYSLQVQLKKADYGSAKWKELKNNVSAARLEMEKMRKTSGLMTKGGAIGSDFLSGLKGGIIGGGVAGAGMALTAGISAAITDTFNIAVDFDDQMRKVAATSRATGGEFQDLRNAAINMGSATRFTASEAAQALNYMALAGWGAGKSIEALPGVLNLAAAAGTDLGITSDIVTDTMSTFGMAAKDAGLAADIFAAAQSRTNTTVEMLGEAMKYAAPQMSSANQTLADTAAVLGLLANQGIKGSMAGTAVNSTLNDLKKSAVDGSLAFGKMNIALYDQAGRFRNIFDIVKEMKSAVAGLSTEQRDAITGGIFEERSIKAINILLNTTQEQIDDVAHSLNNATGEAARMADMMEGGIGGSKRNMESAWEGLQLTLGKTEWAEAWYDMWAEKFTMWRVQVHGILGDAKKEYQSFSDYVKDISLVPKSTGPIGVLAPGGGSIVDGEGGTVKKAGKSSTATPASIYRDLNKELASTKRHMDFMGDSAEYAEVATQKVAQAIDQIFKVGGAGAVQYAEKLKEEYQGLIDATRTGSALSTIPSLSGGVSMKVALPTTFNDQFKSGLEITEKLRKEFGLIDQEAQAFGATYDALGYKISTLQGSIAEGIAAGIPEGMLNPMIEQYRLLGDAMEDVAEKSQFVAATQQLMGALANATESAFEGMASGALTTGEALAQLGKSSISAGLDILKSYLLQAIGKQINDASKFGAIGLAIAGAAVAGLFGIVKGAMSQTKGVSLADGGIAYGRTMAEIGEYSNAGQNPEVVAPLDKLTGIMKNAMGGYGGGETLKAVIRGEDIHMVLTRVQRKMTKYA